MNTQDKLAITEALRFLEMLTVSLDRIGSYCGSNAVDSAEILEKFVTDHDVFKNAAESRELLSRFFSDDLAPGEETSELEKLLDDVKIWTAKENE